MYNILLLVHRFHTSTGPSLILINTHVIRSMAGRKLVAFRLGGFSLARLVEGTGRLSQVTCTADRAAAAAFAQTDRE